MPQLNLPTVVSPDCSFPRMLPFRLSQFYSRHPEKLNFQPLACVGFSFTAVAARPSGDSRTSRCSRLSEPCRGIWAAAVPDESATHQGQRERSWKGGVHQVPSSTKDGFQTLGHGAVSGPCPDGQYGQCEDVGQHIQKEGRDRSAQRLELQL